VTIIEACFVGLTVLAAIATYCIAEVSTYWLGRQRTRDKKEAEIKERGFE